jgi:hypothetical protein
VVVGDGFGAIEVGEGAGDAEDFVVGAGAEPELVDGLFEEGVGAVGDNAVFADGFRVEMGVARVSAFVPGSLAFVRLPCSGDISVTKARLAECSSRAPGWLSE